MKLIILISLIITMGLLSSCHYQYHNVRILRTRAMINAVDKHQRKFHKGDTVCVVVSNVTYPYIDNTGILVDSFANERNYKIGIIIK